MRWETERSRCAAYPGLVWVGRHSIGGQVTLSRMATDPSDRPALNKLLRLANQGSDIAEEMIATVAYLRREDESGFPHTSWTVIGLVLGVTKQSARTYWGPLVDDYNRERRDR